MGARAALYTLGVAVGAALGLLVVLSVAFLHPIAIAMSAVRAALGGWQ